MKTEYYPVATRIRTVYVGKKNIRLNFGEPYSFKVVALTYARSLLGNYVTVHLKPETGIGAPRQFTMPLDKAPDWVHDNLSTKEDFKLRLA